MGDLGISVWIRVDPWLILIFRILSMSRNSLNRYG